MPKRQANAAKSNPVHIPPPDDGFDPFDPLAVAPPGDDDDADGEDSADAPFLPPPPAAPPRPFQRLKDPTHGAAKAAAAEPPAMAQYDGYPTMMYIAAKVSDRCPNGYDTRRVETPAECRRLEKAGWVHSPADIVNG